VRFGEVEQRGIALTPAGRELYDACVAEVDARRSRETGTPAERRPRVDVARDVWRERMPRTEAELAARGLGFFTYRAGADGKPVPEPIVYEDFLPRSAAGIFQSNLTDAGTRDDEQVGTRYDLDLLSEIVGRPIHDPMDLYAAQQAASLRELPAGGASPGHGDHAEV
jgi:uncharacterized glyoxalase superfamily metalloenzyme YdcJ